MIVGVISPHSSSIESSFVSSKAPIPAGADFGFLLVETSFIPVAGINLFPALAPVRVALIPFLFSFLVFTFFLVLVCFAL